MFSRLNLRLLAVFAILFTITHASLFNPERGENGLARRQDVVDGLLTGGSSGSADTTTEKSSTTSKPPSTTTTLPPTTSSSSSTTPTSTSIPSTSSPTTTSPTLSDTSKTETTKPTTTPPPTSLETSQTKDSGDVETTIIKSTPTLVVVKSTVTLGGVVQETDVTMTSSVPVSTTVSQQKGSESTGKGMSASTKKTVIGVVVGIIGAIVLGALFFLAWRIWGRRKNDEDEDDTLSPFGRGTSAHGQEKTSDVGSMPSPFKTTLDQYHNPNARTNVSSNF